MLFNIMNMFTGASELLSGPLPQMIKGSLEPICTEQMISGFKIHLVYYRTLYLDLFYNVIYLFIYFNVAKNQSTAQANESLPT